jgi:hypothetical protein
VELIQKAKVVALLASSRLVVHLSFSRCVMVLVCQLKSANSVQIE